MNSVQNKQQPQQAQQTQNAEQKAGEMRVADEKSVETFGKAMKKDKDLVKDFKGRQAGLGGEGEKSLAAQSSLFSLAGKTQKNVGEREGRGAFGKDAGEREGRAAFGKGAGEREGRVAEDALAGRLPKGEDILAHMGSLSQQPAGPAASAAAQAAATAPVIDGDLTSKLVDRILVATTDGKQNAEVRLHLKDDILPGTEIRITRANDGGVTVQFVTNDIRAEQMLGSRQLTDLQNVLTQNLQVEVRVSTARTDGSMTSDAGAGNQQGQQGRQGGQDQQRDGRSSQHDIFDGLDDEA
ncbi:hypothetical protein LJC09_01225 [Desulfovibrio sp. OttesenSCG-928-F20]|nr:hypothetical protein [Desulfovibrio sp. OttesenSCG-928-F20]